MNGGELVPVVSMLVQALLFLLHWRRGRNGNGGGEDRTAHETDHGDTEDRKIHIAANLLTIAEAKIDMPSNWRAYVREVAKFEANSAVTQERLKK